MSVTKDYVLEFLTREAAGIAEIFGSSCETLIHDMMLPGFPVIAIYNGHVSGRQVGSTTDIYGSHIASRQLANVTTAKKDFINTLVLTKDQRQIKSSTFNFIGDGYHYALGINYDYTVLNNAVRALSGLTHAGETLENQLSQESAHQLNDIFQECIDLIGIAPQAMKKPERLRLIMLLDQRNAFHFQKAITYISEKLQVSRYTVYNYYHELERQHLVSGAINK